VNNPEKTGGPAGLEDETKARKPQNLGQGKQRCNAGEEQGPSHGGLPADVHSEEGRRQQKCGPSWRAGEVDENEERQAAAWRTSEIDENDAGRNAKTGVRYGTNQR